MSDIKKVMGIFIPPVYSSNHQGMQNALFDGNSTVIGIMDSKIEAEKLAEMINSHDNLTNQVAELRAVVFEANKYLDINNLTTIGHGSNLHEWFKQALELTLKDGEL